MLSHFCLTSRFCLPAMTNMTYRTVDENWNETLREKKRRVGNIKVEKKITEEKQSEKDGGREQKKEAERAKRTNLGK